MQITPRCSDIFDVTGCPRIAFAVQVYEISTSSMYIYITYICYKIVNLKIDVSGKFIALFIYNFFRLYKIF